MEKRFLEIEVEGYGVLRFDTAFYSIEEFDPIEFLREIATYAVTLE
jgi:hypothetical protein